MAASALIVSVASIFAMIAGALSKVDFSAGAWPTVAVLPLVGLPFTFILIIAFFVATAIRRSRAPRDA